MHVSFKLPAVKKSQGPVFTELNTQPSKEANNWNLIVMLLVGAGIALRLFHYFDNRSLWIDEIYLSSSLIRLNFLELTGPLDYEQKAPIGFLWLVRASVLLFGTSEMALRLVPLLTGIASLFFFIPVSRYFLKPVGVIVAVGILALAPPLVYHAVEIKQYSMELLVTIVAFYLYTRYRQKNDLPSLLKWGLWGAVLSWFSYSAIFILMGMAGGTALFQIIKKNWSGFFRTALVGSLWLASFLVCFILFTRKYTNSEWLIIWFQQEQAFMPFPPKSLPEFRWFFDAVFKVLYYPLGLYVKSTLISNKILYYLFRVPVLPIISFIVGLVAFFRQSRKLFWILLLPLVFILVASGLKLYPFYERLIVFLAPPLILVIAHGIEYITNRFAWFNRKAFILPALLLVVPLVNSVGQVIYTDLFGDYKKAYYRETLQYINDRYQPGDVVYAYWNTHFNYKFYKAALPLKFEAILGKDARYQSTNTADYFRKLYPDIAALKGNKRVWLIYSQHHLLNIGDFVNTPEYYHADFENIHNNILPGKFLSMGRELDRDSTKDVQVRLYDLSGN